MTEPRAKEFAEILKSEQEFPSDWHIEYTDMFKGYVKVVPSKERGPHRTAFVKFMKSNEDFQLTSSQTFDVLCVLKYDDKGEVSFGASLVMFNCGQDLYCYIYLIKTHKEHRGQHLATDFIKDVAAFAQTQVKPNCCLYIAAGMSETHRPNVFFTKNGFSENAPEHMQDWQQKHCHCMMFRTVQHFVISRQQQKSAPFAANKRNIKAIRKDIEGTQSETHSIAPSNRTSGGNIDKYCPLCKKKISGANWSVHCRKKHPGEVVNPKIYDPSKLDQDGNVVQQQQKESLHGQHKQQSCSSCGSKRETRCLTNGMCAKCVKSVINVVTEPKPLTSHNLQALSKIEEVKQPLLHKRTFNEYEDYAQEDIPEFMVPQPQVKKVKVQQSPGDYNQQNGGQELDTVIKDTTSITKVSVPAIGMAVTSLLDALRAIESSSDKDFEVSLKVSAVCEQFVHQQALTLLKKDSYPRLASLITKILNEQAGQLKQQQLAGLFVAACKLQGPCWSAAVVMLQRRKSDIQQYVLEVFNSHIEVAYGTDIAQWVSGHWRNVQEQQLDIMKQLKEVQSPVDILFLSLAVQVDNVPKFIEYSSFMLQRVVSMYMLESIRKRLTQQRLSVRQFLELCELIQLDNVTSTIQNNTDIFKSTPLQQWTTKVDELKAVSHLINSESVQEAVGEYLRVYGDVDVTFTEDMFSEDTLLGLAMHESFNKPNAKQLGLAQYCMGKIRQCQRQLWCVPSGQGKSRIIAFAAAIAVDTGMFNAVHISYENEALLNRDKHDFESLWIVLGCVDKICYHVGCEFPTQEGELVIVDESDTATFNTPDAFIKLINGRACVCFTATPDNCDGKGVETKVISALKLEVFHYVPNAEVIDTATKLKTDHTQHADSIEAKVSYIQSLVANGPVLVYGTLELKDALTEAVEGLIVVNPQVDYPTLRKLDQAPYKILFADSQFGMRGIDYRCERVPMHLVIAKSFDCTRDALQGVARVGRFGDPCTRIIFDRVELVDTRKQLESSSKLMRYASTVKVGIKQVKVKQATVAQQRNTGAKNMGIRQVQAAQQQFMKNFTTKK